MKGAAPAVIHGHGTGLPGGAEPPRTASTGVPSLGSSSSTRPRPSLPHLGGWTRQRPMAQSRPRRRRGRPQGRPEVPRPAKRALQSATLPSTTASSKSTPLCRQPPSPLPHARCTRHSSADRCLAAGLGRLPGIPTALTRDGGLDPPAQRRRPARPSRHPAPRAMTVPHKAPGARLGRSLPPGASKSLPDIPSPCCSGGQADRPGRTPGRPRAGPNAPARPAGLLYLAYPCSPRSRWRTSRPAGRPTRGAEPRPTHPGCPTPAARPTLTPSLGGLCPCRPGSRNSVQRLVPTSGSAPLLPGKRHAAGKGPNVQCAASGCAAAAEVPPPRHDLNSQGASGGGALVVVI